MKTKTVYRRSIFPAEEEHVFSLLKNLGTLQYIAKPYASFTPIDGDGCIRWEEGQIISFRFKLFCLIPYGIHTIHVVDFSKDGIYTNETNSHVPVWNHRIRLKALPSGETEYSDEVEIGAGWKTTLVYLWAKCFYAHKQKRWIKLLSKEQSLSRVV